MTLIVILFKDLTVIMLRLYKGAAVLSALMKVYTIPCHDRGHINVLLVLQSCTDSPDILPSLSREPYATSSDGACNIGSVEFEEDVDMIIGEGFISINKEVDTGIKQEEISEDTTLRGIKFEPDEVS